MGPHKLDILISYHLTVSSCFCRILSLHCLCRFGRAIPKDIPAEKSTPWADRVFENWLISLMQQAVPGAAYADKVGFLESDGCISYRRDYKCVKQSLYCILELLFRTPSIPFPAPREKKLKWWCFRQEWVGNLECMLDIFRSNQAIIDVGFVSILRSELRRTNQCLDLPWRYIMRWSTDLQSYVFHVVSVMSCNGVKLRKL